MNGDSRILCLAARKTFLKTSPFPFPTADLLPLVRGWGLQGCPHPGGRAGWAPEDTSDLRRPHAIQDLLRLHKPYQDPQVVNTY